MESRKQKPSDDTVRPLVARESDHLDRPGYAETGVLDQVRDLLFGDQARETDHRVQAVDARLTASVEQLREELLERIESLKGELGERMDQLEERVSVQEAEWRGANRTMLQRIEELEKAKADREALARLFAQLASQLEGED